MNDAPHEASGETPTDTVPTHGAQPTWVPTEPPGLPRRSTRAITIAAVALASAVVAAGAVGGGLAWHSHHQEVVRREQATEAKAKAAAKVKAAVDTCRHELGDLVGDLRGIDAALSGSGMTFAAYSAAVNQAEEASGRVDDYAFSDQCESAFADAKQAVSYYGDVSSAWSDCITDDVINDCSAGDAFDASGWNEATPVIERANDEMNGRASGTTS